MNAIMLVLRTGMQWNALNATGICSCSLAYRRFRNRSESQRERKKGAKRSLLCEGKGVPPGIWPAGANLNDFKLCRATLESIPIKRPEPTPERPQGLCLDKGYDYPEVYELAAEFGFTAHFRARGEEAQTLKREASCRARRWVVERTHSWLNRFRQILTRWAHHLARRQLGAPGVRCCGVIARGRDD